MSHTYHHKPTRGGGHASHLVEEPHGLPPQRIKKGYGTRGWIDAFGLKEKAHKIPKGGHSNWHKGKGEVHKGWFGDWYGKEPKGKTGGFAGHIKEKPLIMPKHGLR